MQAGRDAFRANVESDWLYTAPDRGARDSVGLVLKLRCRSHEIQSIKQAAGVGAHPCKARTAKGPGRRFPRDVAGALRGPRFLGPGATIRRGAAPAARRTPQPPLRTSVVRPAREIGLVRPRAPIASGRRQQRAK